MFESKLFSKQTSSSPGVYIMRDQREEIIYVGKAKNLKKRLSSYFKKNLDHPKTKQLVAHIHQIETIVTSTENEAFILENNLIKKYLPKYNILFRDDKSYPYLFLSNDEYPKLIYYRGTKKAKGKYFGPYPSSAVVKSTLNLLQKIFHIRSCNNVFFNNRKRPCLQYQIHRCSAPCVNFITKKEYKENVNRVCEFLEGKNEHLADQIIQKMNEASKNLDYEKAVKYRDQIQAIRETLTKQSVLKEKGDLDIIALVEKQDSVSINLMIVRKGQLLGNKSFIVHSKVVCDENEILESFMMQYYLNDQVEFPKQIVLSHRILHQRFLESELSKKALFNIKIFSRVKGGKNDLLTLSKKNAEDYLNRYLLSKSTLIQKFKALKKVLSMSKIPSRIECFDVSHTSGNETVAASVVFNQEGAVKQDYRRFNIEGVTKGDDFAALKQALIRRYASLKKSDAMLPDLLIMDGGKGQLKQAKIVLEELQLNKITLIAIAKGKERRPGKEMIFLSGQDEPLKIASNDIAFHMIQQIRDEAHRFAVAGHRLRRAKIQKQSLLETIEGIGQKRRQALLKHFGGLQGLKKASLSEISQVKGISVELAKKIISTLR